MNPDLVPMLLDISIDPCDGSVHPSLQYVLIRGFTAMGWEQPKAASEDMAMEILKMVRPKLASGGTVAPSVQPLVGEKPLRQASRPDAGGGAREALDCLRSIAEMKDDEPRQPDDADWRFRALECKRAAQCAIAALSTPSDAVNESAEARLREDETGWLVEVSDPPVYAVLTADHDENWTHDAGKAIRFARREDAQAYSDHIGWTSPPVRIVEHMWPALSAGGDEAKKSDGVPPDEQEQMVECPSCRNSMSRPSACKLCGDAGEVTERQSLDFGSEP